MKRKTLRRAIEALLFEADVLGMPSVTYGIYDRPGPTDESDPDFKPTVTPDVPLKPTELMSVQLADERPPIEDDEYVPTSVADLRQAASAIAEMVPPDQVESFYETLLKMLDSAKTKQADDETPRSKQVEAEEAAQSAEEVKAEARRRLDRLMEAYWGDITLGRHRPEGEDEDEDDDFDDESEPPPPPEDEKKVLAALAKEFGYSGVPGIRQALQRLFTLMKYLLTKVGPDAIEEMMGTVVPEYVNLALEAGIIDETDASHLMTSPVYVRELDSFRYYYNALYRPVYKKLKTEAEKSARQLIVDLGIPKEVQDTVFNQVTGGAARKDSTILNKMLKKRSPQEAKKLLDLVRDNFTVIKDELDKIPEDLLDRTHDYVDSLGEKKKKQILLQSFGLAKEFQEDEARRARDEE